MKAKYEIAKITDDAVWVVDLNGPKSITNDAEAVVADLYSRFGNRRFIYRDTMGNWDELVHHNGIFQTFEPVLGLRRESDE